MHLLEFIKRRGIRFSIFVAAGLFVACVSDSIAAQDDALNQIEFPRNLEASDDASAPDVSSKLSDEKIEFANQLIDELASGTFAVRERAAEKLLALGTPIVPLLRERADKAVDLELKLRSRALIKTLNDGDLQAKIDAFRNGEDIELEGWPIFRIMFGDGDRSREVFVELMVDYPELVKSFHGTSRDLAMAMQAITGRLSERLRTPPVNLKVSDGIALLLPVSDDNVPLSPAYERLMMMILRMHPVSRASSDPAIGQRYSQFVNKWISRSTLANRMSVFTFALQTDRPAAYPVAIKSLTETTDAQILAISMQVIARFGRKEDISVIAPFLNDNRPLTTVMIGRKGSATPLLSDAAMATIAVLNHVPLSDLGYDPSSEHPKFGFIYESLIFSKDEPSHAEQRKAVRAKIDQLLKQGVMSEEPENES